MSQSATDFLTPRHIDVQELGPTRARVTLEPLERGFGHTLGNTLRRILLSSIQGCAITAVKITAYKEDGSPHLIASEFEAIPAMVEDTPDFISNLKQVQLKLVGDLEEKTILLELKGARTLYAKDLAVDTDLEIGNPDFPIATLMDKANLELEVQVNLGRGYVPAERSEKYIEVIGTIPVDALFSPVRKVKYAVENTRVGQRTDYDKLILEIWTNGTITPELALVGAAAKAGIDKTELLQRVRRSCEIPFESEQQYMAVGYDEGDRTRLYVKGSVERVLSFCGAVRRADVDAPLDQEAKSAIQTATESLASEAMRVIALAYLDLPASPRKLTCPHFAGKLTFLGLAGMADPPREEARLAIRHCRDAGIRVVMITGDHRATAEAIARQLELPAGRTVDGAELQRMSDEDLAQSIESISVFARIEPLHKLRIVDELKARGHVVAMTGDGVNDAPALKAANIGIAMGESGTDVAREVADIIIAGDNLEQLVQALRGGRTTYGNIRKSVHFFLSTNLTEIIVMFACMALGLGFPLTVMQLLWINIISDIFPGLALSREEPEPGLMAQPPRRA